MLPIFSTTAPPSKPSCARTRTCTCTRWATWTTFFWPYTTWFASQADGQVTALFLLYSGGGLPVVLALARAGADLERLRALLEASLPLLPRRFYSHLTPGLDAVLAAAYRLEPHGRYLKMALTDPSRLGAVDTSAVVGFTPGDAEALRRYLRCGLSRQLVRPAHAGNRLLLWHPARWADRQRGRDPRIFSPHPGGGAGQHHHCAGLPRAGLGKQVTARLCQELRKTVDTIGLNVRADNAPALAVTPVWGLPRWGVR